MTSAAVRRRWLAPGRLAVTLCVFEFCVFELCASAAEVGCIGDRRGRFLVVVTEGQFNVSSEILRWDPAPFKRGYESALAKELATQACAQKHLRFVDWWVAGQAPEAAARLRAVVEAIEAGLEPTIQVRFMFFDHDQSLPLELTRTVFTVVQKMDKDTFQRELITRVRARLREDAFIAGILASFQHDLPLKRTDRFLAGELRFGLPELKQNELHPGKGSLLAVELTDKSSGNGVEIKLRTVSPLNNDGEWAGSVQAEVEDFEFPGVPDAHKGWHRLVPLVAAHARERSGAVFMERYIWPYSGTDFDGRALPQ